MIALQIIGSIAEKLGMDWLDFVKCRVNPKRQMGKSQKSGLKTILLNYLKSMNQKYLQWRRVGFQVYLCALPCLLNI